MARPFIANIGDLVGRRAEPRSEQIVASVDWRLELSAVLAEPPLVADLVIHPATGGLLVTGTIACRAHHVCHLCLDEYDEDLVVDTAQLFSRDPVEDETYPITGKVIDLEQMLRDDVMLALPLLPTCPAGCRGVVTTQGTDLNTDLPSDPAEMSPFAVLRDLIPPTH